MRLLRPIFVAYGVLTVILIGGGIVKIFSEESGSSSTSTAQERSLDDPFKAEAARFQAQIDDYEAHKDSYITQAQADAETHRNAIATLADADYSADIEKFHFSCTRHGDFIAIVADRQDNQTLRISIKFDTITSMTLASGHRPDNAGTLHYATLENRNSNELQMDGPLFGLIYAIGLNAVPGRLMLYGSTSDSYGFTFRQYNYNGSIVETSQQVENSGDTGNTPVTSPAWPRFAMDDRIDLMPSQQSFFVPGGVGPTIWQSLVVCMEPSAPEKKEAN